MVKNDILRFYVGVLVMFLTYRLVFSLVLTTLETVEQIALQEKQTNDRKSTGSTDSKIISNNLRGGQGKAVTWFIRKVVPGVYKRAMQIAVSSGVVATLGVMRGIASYDWWATYISYGLVNLTEEDKIILASLRRMRLGLPTGIVCIAVTTELQVMLYNGDFKEAIDEWMVLLTRYDKLSEVDPKKNGFFACIVLFITGLIVKYPGFAINLLRYLQYLCVTGRISYNTYLEILWQILIESEREQIPARKAVFNFVIKNFFSD